jgi:hypothetical protein
MITPDEFRRYVFVTAIEGGVNYWAAVLDYDVAGATARLVDTQELPEGLARETYLNVIQRDRHIADLVDQMPAHIVYPVTVATVAKGFRVLQEPVEHLSDSYRKRVLAAARKRDAVELDSGDADNIIQLGIFGKIVYS